MFNMFLLMSIDFCANLYNLDKHKYSNVTILLQKCSHVFNFNFYNTETKYFQINILTHHRNLHNTPLISLAKSLSETAI